MSREKPRIGVFVCNCGINIGSVVKVPEVAEYARSLPHVVYVEENLYTCSQDTQDKLTEVIKEHGLNRVVVAACSPRTHEPLFQETMNNAGLNKYLFEMANIRNHDSWVHAQEPEVATQKAKALVAMAVAKSALLNPLKEADLPVTQAALVVGGGVAGMSAALNLAQQGYPVHLVETGCCFGRECPSTPQHAIAVRILGAFRSSLEDQISREPKITVHLNSTITGVDGFVGNFNTTITNGSSANHH